MDNKPQNQDVTVDPTSLQMPKTLPILPLHGSVFFPGMGFPLQVASESSKQLIDDALLGNRMIGLVPSRKEQTPDDAVISGDDEVTNFQLGMSDGGRRKVRRVRVDLVHL